MAQIGKKFLPFLKSMSTHLVCLSKPSTIFFFVCLCRLHDEIAQREEAENNMQSFRQVHI